jgi:hypothetical protein
VLPALPRGATPATRWSAACRRRGREADAHRQVRHGGEAQRRDGAAEAAARRRQGRRPQRQGPDEDAAAAAEAAALHSRHRAGRARLFPDAAILAGRFEENSPTWCACWWTAMPRPARACAARSRRAPVEYPDVGVYHPRIKGRIADAAEHLPAGSGAAERGTVGCCCCAPMCWPATPAHYDGVIARWRRAACA